jgi:hypothetical protein
MSQVQVGHLLAEAEKVVARVRYCWLLTAAETGGANARPMGRLLPGPNEDDWIIRFITGGLFAQGVRYTACQQGRPHLSRR